KKEEERQKEFEQERQTEERLKQERAVSEQQRALERKQKEELKEKELEAERKIVEQRQKDEEAQERIKEEERLANARAREEERLKVEREMEEHERQKELRRLAEEREYERKKAEKRKEQMKLKEQKEEEHRIRARRAEAIRLEAERIKEETRLFKIEQKCAQALERKRKEQMQKELEMDRRLQEEKKREMEAKRKRMEEEEQYWEHAYLEKDPKNVYYDYVTKINKDLYEKKRARLEFLRNERNQRIKAWEKLKGISLELDAYSGAYADLYKSPSEPVYAQAFEKKKVINIQPRFSYATDAYLSTLGHHGDVTTLEFGSDPITFGDISLAGRLLEEGYLQQLGTRPPPPVFTDNMYLLNPYAVVFNGRDERIDISLDFAYYIKDFDCALGFQLPIAFQKHKLEAAFLTEDFERSDTATNNLANNAAFIFSELLKTKDIAHIGGTATGLGDLALFGNVKIHSGFADKVLVGARVQLPTASQASMHMLWPIALGNDGCLQVNLFTSGLIAYNSYINPHIFIEGTLNAPAYVRRRVPKLFVADMERGVTPKVTSYYGPMALGSYFQTVRDDCNPQHISEFDTTIKGLADNIARVRLTKGPELSFKIGNLFEHVFVKRGFFDLYYDLHAKWQDSVSGLNTQEWNLDVVKRDTQSLAHVIGGEYSYQFDLGSRIRLGMQYVVSGMNVAMALEVFGGLTYSF
ncbi:MAG: hypothetical protein WCT20_04915, partial [Candidatus Babeliales bacterium]